MPKIIVSYHVYMYINIVITPVFCICVDSQFKVDLESELTPYALYRLERGGVQVRREISKKNRDFQAIVLRQNQPNANFAMIKWMNSARQTSIKATWKNLCLVLRLVDLDDVAEKIDKCLSGGAVKLLSERTSDSTEQVRESEGATKGKESTLK